MRPTKVPFRSFYYCYRITAVTRAKQSPKEKSQSHNCDLTWLGMACDLTNYYISHAS